jgi:mRNA interferase MazF
MKSLGAICYHLGMEKDFDSWNAKKSDLNNRQDIPFFHEREIWFCHVGVNIGVEVDGVGINFLRPVVIIKKINNTAFIAIPLTRTPRQGKFYFPMTDDPGDSFAVLSQV